MKELELYEIWLKNAVEDSDLIPELSALKGNTAEIKDHFYRELNFGTAGIRGVIGAGTNRMNIYTIRKATQGLAQYLNDNCTNPSVAISYDSRIKSDVFAQETAAVLAGNGISVHLYKELMPTPCLSFAVRELGCDSGVMVTASHNPAKYNGYKAYGPDGCQMTVESADKVMANINNIDVFTGIKRISFDDGVTRGLIKIIPDTVIENYLQQVLSQAIHPSASKKANLKVVFTPLNGTGNKPVREILKRIGINDVSVVFEQEHPDGNFTTCPFPNPEISEALDLGLKKSREIKADLLIATDPDADRVGIAVPDQKGDYVLISGNEVGALLLNYICEGRTKNKTMPSNPISVKTIVTTKLIDNICRHYNVELKSVLTGFKHIGEVIGKLEAKGEESRYIFGFEESYGYLSGTYVRDKDAVVASMLLAEMASFYKLQGISVFDALKLIYDKYGKTDDICKSFVCEGESGMEKMAEIMSNLRKSPPSTIGGLGVTSFYDYLTDTKIINGKSVSQPALPKSDVLAFELGENASVTLRPSGTEPKLKTYYSVTAKNELDARALSEKIQQDFTEIIGF